MNAPLRPDAPAGTGHNSRAMDPAEIAHVFEERGHEWSDRNAAAQLLEDMEKSILAEITQDYRPKAKSMAEAESLARASKRFRDHVADAVEARRLANRARASFDAMRMEIELLRTRSATDRALMGMR